jgi:exopolyphosphatase / guanosine-5'-triphosphate,3'-diphosphate pyrophosphatase
MTDGNVNAQNEPKPLAAKNARLAAVIDIGASAIRLEIAEIGEQGELRTLEQLRKGCHLGKDTFTKNRIQQSTIQECVNILQGFKRVMEEYGITQPEQIRAVATSSVREAENRDTFLDRVYIGAHINVRAIDEAEESRLTYMAAQDVVESEPDLKNGNVLVVDVGGGSTELLLVQKGQVTFSDSYRLGSLRMREMLDSQRAPSERVRTILGQHIQRIVEQISRNAPASDLTAMVAMSSDSRFVAAHLCPDWAASHAARFDYRTFAEFVDKVLPLSAERIASKYHLSFQEAETVVPGLLVYLHLARAFKTDCIIIPKSSLRDGLLKEMTLAGFWTGSFARQVIHAARALGEKYRVDEKHSRHVADLCVKLFRELQPVHQLDKRHELLIEVAALVHEVGGFISNRSHHKHSMYLILNSDLFGLTHNDMTLIALVARYHRRAMPNPTHPEYNSLDRDSRVAVSKLAAILRVADALDRNHMQRIRDFSLTHELRRFVISVRHVEDLTIERMALMEKGAMFEEIYGIPIVLQEERAQAEESVDER